MPKLLEIDGSQGEGGGQIIRSALTLSLVTRTPFRISNIRARRSRPGLLKQHLTAVRAAAEIGSAETKGATLHSSVLTFRPTTAARAGDYRFAIKTAGSSMLVLQTVLPVLLTASGPSHVTLEGGTHNPFAPPFDFVEKTFLPLLRMLGAKVTATLVRPGFYPAGGGEVHVSVEPPGNFERLELLERGSIRDIRARAVVAKLPTHIAERELGVLATMLQLSQRQLQLVEETRSIGPGNVVTVEIETDALTEVCTAFGEKGRPAERVAEEAAREAQAYLDADVPVGLHLADQLLLPLALGAGGSYVTTQPTNHTLTNIDVIQEFLPTRIDITERTGGTYLIDVVL
jgi:RNA 3'-terminal phosphate cyclase (ATP)